MVAASLQNTTAPVRFWRPLPTTDNDEGSTTLALLELCWTFFTYAYVISKLTFPKMTKFFKYPAYRLLAVHIILSIVEVFRYHVRSIRGPVIPDILDLCLGIGHSYTSILAARDRKIGDKTLTRPCHQTMALTRIMLSTMAYTLQNAFYNHASIRIMNAFYYPRFFIFVIHRLNLLPQYSNVYAAAIFLSCVLVDHDGGLPLGPHLFLIAYIVNILINRWAAKRVVEGHTTGLPYQVAKFLERAGFAELRILQAASKTK